MGVRAAKKKLYVDGPADIRSEGQYYVRDPQGNVLAVYQYNEENIALVDDKDSLYLEELHLYGSARLGILKKALALRYRDESGTANWSIRTLAKTTLAQSSYQQLELGRRRYELSNHLGNVLATVSDKSLGQDSSQTGQADYYLAQVSSASLYYPFGWEMPGRKFVSGEEYRFGFNGKEDDRDWGMQNIQDYGFRLYNPSIGKFLSVDPLSPDYPWYTPYQFAGNKPIRNIDLDGLEEYPRGYATDKHLSGSGHAPSTSESIKNVMSDKMTSHAKNTFKPNIRTDYTPLNQLSESQKQKEFMGSAKNTAAILIYEFTTGTGKKERNFKEYHSITREMMKSYATAEALGWFLNKMDRGEMLDRNDNGKWFSPADLSSCEVDYYYFAFSPDKEDFNASAAKHFMAYGEGDYMGYRGGMQYAFEYFPNLETVSITISDAYTEPSAYFRLGSYHKRKGNGEGMPGSVTKTTFQFTMTLDEIDKFKKTKQWKRYEIIEKDRARRGLGQTKHK